MVWQFRIISVPGSSKSIQKWVRYDQTNFYSHNLVISPWPIIPLHILGVLLRITTCARERTCSADVGASFASVTQSNRIILLVTFYTCLTNWIELMCQNWWNVNNVSLVSQITWRWRQGLCISICAIELVTYSCQQSQSLTQSTHNTS
jgi:hypothetical protein